MPKTQKPGEAPKSPGIYEERGPRGGKVTNGKKVTIDPKDGHLPPTSESGNTWEKVRSTKR